MVIGVILLEDAVDVSVKKSILGIVVRVGNYAESELLRVIRIDLICLF